MFLEREGDQGFIETALVAMHPEASLTFCNLGWPPFATNSARSATPRGRPPAPKRPPTCGSCW